MKATPLCSLLAAVLAVSACNEIRDSREHASSDGSADFTDRTGDYLGQTPPGTTPQLFAVGLLSTALHDDGAPRFSPDGRELWFRKWAVPHDIIGYMRQEGKRWTAPVQFREFGRYIVSVPIFTVDGSGAFFLSRRPLPGESEADDYNVWYATRGPEGWSELTVVEGALNTPDDEYPYSIAADGTLYLQARYEDTLGDYDIYSSRPSGGTYEAARNLGAPVNTEFSDGAPVIAPDGSFLVFTSSGRPDSLGSIDLYVAFRSEDGDWGPGINLGPEVNSPSADKFASLSPDGNYLFFVSHRGADRSYEQSDLTYDELMQRNLGPMNGDGDVWWVSTEVIHRLRPAGAGDE